MHHPMTVTDLRCEYKHNPLGIDAVPPRLSWRLEDALPDLRAIWDPAEYPAWRAFLERALAEGVAS